MSGKITRSVVNGAAWSGISQFLGQGLRFVGGIVLWRLLSPDDFGLLAIVAIVTAIAGNLIDMGFIEALVQRKVITEKHLVTVFWFILATGITLSVIVISISPLLSAFFKNPQIGPLLSVSSVIFIIQASSAVHSALLRRRLQFFQAATADVADGIGYLVGAITAAFLGLGVWSLVIGNITGCIPGVALRWIFSGWRPAFSFSWQSLKELWSFGINNVGMRIVYVIMDKLDYLIIGKFLLPATLGFYSQALKIARIPSDSLGAIGNRIGLPALSLVQNENQRLQYGLLKGESFLALMGLPIFFAMAAVGPELIFTIQGPQWVQATVPLQILCVSGCVAVLNIGIPAVFLAKGRPDINLKLSLVQLGLLVPSLLIGVRFGAEGVAIVISSVSLIAWLIRQRFVHQVINLSFKAYLNSLRPALVASLIMTAAILGLHYVLTTIFTLPELALLIIEVLWGTGVYILTLKAIKAPALEEMINLILEMVRPYRRSVNNRIRETGKIRQL